MVLRHVLRKENTMYTNKISRVSRDQRLIDGLTKHLGMSTAIFVLGQKYTIKQIVSVLQGRIAKTKAASAAKATWTETVRADRQQATTTKEFVAGVRQTLLTMFAAVNVLADFGISPRKTRKVLSTGDKATAVAKAKATRKARNTVGKTEKLKIKGHLPAPTVPAAPTASDGAPAKA
jgi:hypothetical protein